LVSVKKNAKLWASIVSVWLRTEACVYLTFGLFILIGQLSAALEVNDKGKGRILNKGKGNIVEGIGNIAEIEF